MDETPLQTDLDLGSLLSRRMRGAAFVLLTPICIAGLLMLHMLQQHETASDFANVFADLRDELHEVEFNLSRAHATSGTQRTGHLDELELHYLNLLEVYTALHMANPDGGEMVADDNRESVADAVLELVEARGIDAVQVTRDRGIADAAMPASLRDVWEIEKPKDEAGDMPGALSRAEPRGDGAFEKTLAETILAVEQLVAKPSPTDQDLNRAQAVVLTQLGPTNHAHMRNLSAVLVSRMEWSARMPLFLLAGIISVLIGGLCIAHMAILRPLSARLSHLYSDLVSAREKASDSERAKTEFLASMSHEIRTPMNGVMGMAELLAGTNLDTRQRMFIEIIQSSAQSLLAIINDILDFSRIDAGHLRLEAEPFKISELAAEPLLLLSEQAHAKGLELTMRVDPEAERFAIGDFGRLRQVLTNIAGNAIKFTPAGQVSVDLRTELSGDQMTLFIDVRDTGIGIPREKLAGIFDRFTQVDQSSAREQEGTGLGLAISKGLITAMGGDIEVESVVGTGSVFRIFVPLGAHHTQVTARHVPRDVHGCRVLVIDDNETNRLIAQELLTNWGFEGVSAVSGKEGLQKLLAAARGDRAFDLVLLDHHMPGMDGAETARRIRSTPDLRDLPIVLLSSIADDVSSQAIRALGIQGFLVKPVLSSPLFDAIMAALSRPPPCTDTEVQPSQSPPQPIAEHGPRVLIVDDNRVNIRVAELMLESLGIGSFTTATGFEAIEIFETRQPALILMDVSMPGIDGLEATRRIRLLEQERGWPPTPIVGLTAHAMESDRKKCLDAGMDDYLSKPLKSDALHRTVKAFLPDNDGDAAVGAIA